jgi:hypothetical protein
MYKYVQQQLFVQNLVPCVEYRWDYALHLFGKEIEEKIFSWICALRWFCLQCDQLPGVYL